MLEVWRQRRRIKSPSEASWFHLWGPWIKMSKVIATEQFRNRSKVMDKKCLKLWPQESLETDPKFRVKMSKVMTTGNFRD